MRDRLVRSSVDAEPPTRTSGTEQNQRVDSGSDESVRPVDPVENPNPRPVDPEVNAENPTRPSPMDVSTAQSRLTPESPSQKKFFEKFKATLSDEGFKAFAESNPAKARELVDKAVAELISKSKTNKQKSTALAQRAEAMIKGHGYAFKKGGIIKASLGQQLRNF